MSNSESSFDPKELALDGLDDAARLASLSGQITKQNIYDGSAASREYARLAIKNFDEVLQILEELEASRHCSADDRELIKNVTAVLLSKKANAQRAIGLNS